MVCVDNMYSTHVVLSYLGGCLILFVISTNLTWSTPIIPKLTNESTSPIGRVLATEEITWVSSILTIGAAFGVYIWSRISDILGKKITCICTGVLHIACHLILAFATKVEWYYVARFFLGTSVGGVLTIFPVYVTELIPKYYRETLTPFMSVASCSGMLFSNALCPFVTIKKFSLVIAGLSTLIFIFFYIFGEEVPYYYLLQKQDVLARAAFEKLRGGYEDIDNTFDDIKNEFLEQKESTYKCLLYEKSLRKALIISLVLLTIQQTCGIIIILLFGQNIFMNMDPRLSPVLSVIILSSLQLLSSFLPIIFITKYGKKPLIITSGIGMGISELILGIYSYYGIYYTIPKSISILPLLCLVSFILFYNLGMGCYPWIIMSEIFPTKMKAAATSLASVNSWIFAFLTAKFFIPLTDSIGMHGYLAICAMICFVGSIFTKFYVIETHNKSLEEIQRELSSIVLSEE